MLADRLPLTVLGTYSVTQQTCIYSERRQPYWSRRLHACVQAPANSAGSVQGQPITGWRPSHPTLNGQVSISRRRLSRGSPARSILVQRNTRCDILAGATSRHTPSLVCGEGGFRIMQAQAGRQVTFLHTLGPLSRGAKPESACSPIAARESSRASPNRPKRTNQLPETLVCPETAGRADMPMHRWSYLSTSKDINPINAQETCRARSGCYLSRNWAPARRWRPSGTRACSSRVAGSPPAVTRVHLLHFLILSRR
jgi:hypothetical protein